MWLATIEEQPEGGVVWRSLLRLRGVHPGLVRRHQHRGGQDRLQAQRGGLAVLRPQGRPRPIKRDDVRRVLANWPEYGGMVLDKKAKDRPAYSEPDVDEMPHHRDRAVFPVKLLRKVAKLRKSRSFRPVDNGVKKQGLPLSAVGA